MIVRTDPVNGKHVGVHPGDRVDHRETGKTVYCRIKFDVADFPLVQRHLEFEPFIMRQFAQKHRCARRQLGFSEILQKFLR